MGETMAEENGKKRTIDERLDALAQSVELLAHMQQKTEKEIAKLGRLIRIIVVDHETRLLRLEGLDEADG
jgi:hypothetical protein